MRLCPGGGGAGLFFDRVELPPGVSVEGGPDGGGAGGAIHKTHEAMRSTNETNQQKQPQSRDGGVRTKQQNYPDTNIRRW